MLLIVDYKNTTLRYQNQALRLEREGHKPRTIPLNLLEQVVVYGNPLVESNVWRALASAGIPATLLAGRGQSAHAVLASGLATQLPARRLQHALAANALPRLAMARHVVEQKFCSYLLPLRTLNALYNVDPDSNNAFALQLASASNKLASVDSIAALMGVEGQVAQAWFVLLAKSLPFHLKFAGRNRRPPRDPVNALLSLGYTLIGAEIRQAIIANGLDPALGFLHQDYPGRESLVLDVTEWLRAGVDDFVLRWLAAHTVDEGTFYYREDSGCRLSKTARPLFYQAWGLRRYHWPRPFQDEAGDEPEDDEQQDSTAERGTDWPEARLPEILNGQIMKLRQFMKTLAGEEQTGQEVSDALAGTGDGCGCDESGLEDAEE